MSNPQPDEHQHDPSLTKAGASLVRSEAWHARRAARPTARSAIAEGDVVGYARYSTSGQTEDSIERQVEAIERAAAAQGVRLVRIFEDRGTSGARSDRQGLTDMLAFLRGPGPRPSRVLIESADRLARDLKVFVDLWDAALCRKRNKRQR